MSPSQRQLWQHLARSSWLFFPFTSSSSSASLHDKDSDAQQPSTSANASGHNPQRAGSPDTGSSVVTSSDPPDRSPRLPRLSPIELDNDAAIALAFLLGSATAFGAFTVYHRYFKRIRSAEWITPDMLRRKRWITGIVTRCVLVFPDRPRFKLTPTPFPPAHAFSFFLSFYFGTHSVGDADNFRLYHTPGFGWRGLFKFRHVPPTAKRGAQPLYLPVPANMILKTNS